VIHFLGYWIEHKSSELATYVNTGVQTWMWFSNHRNYRCKEIQN
jgi:hypothetical protein